MWVVAELINNIENQLDLGYGRASMPIPDSMIIPDKKIKRNFSFFIRLFFLFLFEREMSDQNSKKALVIVTDGSEEIETVVSGVYFMTQTRDRAIINFH